MSQRSATATLLQAASQHPTQVPSLGRHNGAVCSEEQVDFLQCPSVRSRKEEADQQRRGEVERLKDDKCHPAEGSEHGRDDQSLESPGILVSGMM